MTSPWLRAHVASQIAVNTPPLRRKNELNVFSATSKQLACEEAVSRRVAVESLAAGLGIVAASASVGAAFAVLSRRHLAGQRTPAGRQMVATHRAGAAVVMKASEAVVEPAEDGSAGERRWQLNENWERALDGNVGDVWTEPQVFSEFLGRLTAHNSGVETSGPLQFERISTGPGGDLILYIPGIDFTGVFAACQFRGLAAQCGELWRCFVGPEDRTPFAQMVENVVQWVQSQIYASQSHGGVPRRVLLFGESFGGLLALAVALRLGRALDGLVLVNPATSFGRTPWALLGRALAALPEGDPLDAPKATSDLELLEEMGSRAQQATYAYLGSFALCSAVADPVQLQRTASRVVTTMLQNEGGINPVLKGFLTYPEELARLLPPDTVRFRLRAWLRDGCEAVGSELRARPASKSLMPPTLLVASENDRLLVSSSEAQRLQPMLEERCGKKLFQVVQLPDSGHAPLDGRVDLAAMIRESPICKPPPKRRNYVADWKPPTLEELEEGSRGVESLANIVSPVFCSRDPDTGARAFGLSGVPDPTTIGRPVLLVGNHQLLALDLGPLVREFLIERGFAPRGLAHPNTFPDSAENEMLETAGPTQQDLVNPEFLESIAIPFEFRSLARSFVDAAEQTLGGTRQPANNAPRNRGGGAAGLSFERWGAVPVTPRNFYRLLERHEAILLFPGGAKEALHGTGDKYRLFWPEQTDFVRAAARFGATIVPFGAVGCAENVTVLSPEMSSMLGSALGPVFGRNRRNSEQSRRSLRVQNGGLMPISETLQDAPEFPGVLPRMSLADQAQGGLGDRFYFSFGQPVDLTEVDPKDKTACGNVYNKLREAVKDETAWLLEARTRDPYRNFLSRQAFERIANLDPLRRKIGAGPLKGKVVHSYGRRAPSFSL